MYLCVYVCVYGIVGLMYTVHRTEVIATMYVYTGIVLKYSKQCMNVVRIICRILYTVQCTVCTVHCTVYSVQCALYSVHCTVYTVGRTLNTVRRTLYGVECIHAYLNRINVLRTLHKFKS